MRTYWMFCILAIVTTGLTACSQAPECFRKDIFCAALVTDTRGIEDLGLNQNTWAGMEQSQSEGIVNEVAYIESVNVKDFEKNIAFFVDSGYDVIVTSGISLREATLQSAKLHPESVFIGINQTDNDSLPNFIPVTFAEEQMGFFAGALAARLTMSGSVGAVCETSGIDSIWQYCEGFRAGTKYMDDSVRVNVVYRDNESSDKLFVDDDWGFENAQILIQNGVDVIFAAGGETGVGALRAAGEAGILSIGVERDQAAALGGERSNVVTSLFGQINLTVRELMRTVRNGKVPEESTSPIGYIPFDEFVQKSVLLEMENIAAGLENGDIKVHIPLEKP